MLIIKQRKKMKKTFETITEGGRSDWIKNDYRKKTKIMIFAKEGVKENVKLRLF